MAGRRRRLLSSLRRRLSKPEPKPPTRSRFDNRAEQNWKDIEAEYLRCFDGPSSSMVSTWEVLTTELHAILQATPSETNSDQVTRFSDALVPLQAPIHQARTDAKKQWALGAKEAASSQHYDAAIQPLAQPVFQWAESLVDSWKRTVDYLKPVLQHLERPPADALYALGDTLRSCALARAQHFKEQLQQAAQSANPQAQVQDAIDVYCDGMMRDIEVHLYSARAFLTQPPGAVP